MTPIQKAKEIIVAFNNFYLEKPITATVERFLESEQAAALLSGEDWKEDWNEPINIDFNTRVVVTDNKGKTRKYKLIEVDH